MTIMTIMMMIANDDALLTAHISKKCSQTFSVKLKVDQKAITPTVIGWLTIIRKLCVSCKHAIAHVSIEINCSLECDEMSSCHQRTLTTHKYVGPLLFMAAHAAIARAQRNVRWWNFLEFTGPSVHSFTVPPNENEWAWNDISFSFFFSFSFHPSAPTPTALCCKLRVCVRWRRIKTYTRTRANWRPRWSLRCSVQWIFDSLFTHLRCSAAVFFPHYALRETHCFIHSEAEPDNNWSSCCASKLNIFNHSENCWQRNTRRMEWNQRVLHVKIGLFIARENDLPQFIEAEVYRCWAMMGWHFTIKKNN